MSSCEMCGNVVAECEAVQRDYQARLRGMEREMSVLRQTVARLEASLSAAHAARRTPPPPLPASSDGDGSSSHERSPPTAPPPSAVIASADVVSRAPLPSRTTVAATPLVDVVRELPSERVPFAATAATVIGSTAPSPPSAERFALPLGLLRHQRHGSPFSAAAARDALPSPSSLAARPTERSEIDALPLRALLSYRRLVAPANDENSDMEESDLPVVVRTDRREDTPRLVGAGGRRQQLHAPALITAASDLQGNRRGALRSPSRHHAVRDGASPGFYGDGNKRLVRDATLFATVRSPSRRSDDGGFVDVDAPPATTWVTKPYRGGLVTGGARRGLESEGVAPPLLVPLPL